MLVPEAANLFVDLQNMPDDYLLRNINGQDVWVSEMPNEILEIKEDSHVRIRIANIQLQPEKLVRLCNCTSYMVMPTWK
jgi:DNA-directed RNA polymerase subunit E'/Rpb7